MILGIVSNCWRTQLEQGVELDALLETAARIGYRAIELRQTCLGRYEDAESGTPDAGALSELPRRFPQITFNLALASPFFNAAIDVATDPCFNAGVKAAEALAGKGRPHLRLVDIATTDEQVDPHDLDPIAGNVVRLVEPLVNSGGRLSLENAGQSWLKLQAILAGAKTMLGERACHLRMCYDPCNLLGLHERSVCRADCERITRSLRADELSMIHFKQLQAGRHQPSVGEGDLDWATQLAEFESIKFDGPALLEIAPDEQIWDRLRESRAYLERLCSGLFVAAAN